MRLLRDGATTFAILALAGFFALKMNDRPEVVKSGSFYAIDGDTLDHHGERLRLIGIDAPEYRQQCQRNGEAWACGQAARDMLVKLMAGAPLDCRGSRRDKYRRLLVTCRAAGVDVNAQMVASGMAVSYGDYGTEEAQAREARSGLWAGRFERPQDYRRDEAAGRNDPLGGMATLIGRLLQWN
jgi:endonuclease YncB( thermonuclease family)